MARAVDCIARVAAAAGRKLSDDEIAGIYERVHKAALDLKAGRKSLAEITLGGKLGGELKKAGEDGDTFVQQAAARAAEDMQAEAALRLRRANLQAIRLGSALDTWRAVVAGGLKPLEAAKLLIARDYSGRANVESIEQRTAGYQAELLRHLQPAWKALGDDFLGFFHDPTKVKSLIKELRGEDSGDAMAKKGAKAFHETAEKARLIFNSFGGDIARLDDWSHPQHHSQERVARAGRDPWINAVMPLLDRSRYVDELGRPMSEPELRRFLGKAWENIATNGYASIVPGKGQGGSLAGRHSESRQIHFKDADATIEYWNKFGEKTVFELLHDHVDRMSRDIAFVEKFGPNPDLTYRTMRDEAMRQGALASPADTGKVEAQAAKLDTLWNYVTGRVKPSANPRFSGIADAIANLNVAGKLGGAALASLYGDKPVMEAVSHLNNLPAIQRWRNELVLLNPASSRDRALLRQQGLMLESMRSGLYRFYEGLGQLSTTGKIANAVMRITGMQAINDLRKGAFAATLMNTIGSQIKRGVTFDKLAETDVRALQHLGIDEADWRVWQMADLDDFGGGNSSMLTPDAIARIPDSKASPEAKRSATVKLLGAVNTESEFAIVTPGWSERAAFYGDLQRGTVRGEVIRSILQFKAFPWTYFRRGMDLVANGEGAASKAAMVAYLVAATTLAGAMLLQTREVLAGKDPRKMWADKESAAKFWASSMLAGGGFGIYGDFLGTMGQERFGIGPLELMSGPTIGPLLEMGVIAPAGAAVAAYKDKDSNAAATMARNARGFVPGANIWYARAALDHLIWNRVLESLSPGYLNNVRKRSMRQYDQDWWWQPDESTPDRFPDFSQATK